MEHTFLKSDVVRRAFESSRKQHLLVTGSRSSGKSTLICGIFPSHRNSVTTYAVPKKAVYMKSSSGETAVIGVFDETSAGTSNRMKPCYDGFTGLGVRAVNECIASCDEWSVVDEIGYLESGCSEYTDALLRLFDIKRVAAVVRKQDTPFISSLLARNDVFVVDLDAPYGNLGCVIMASGLATRFGSNKLMADFCGRPMIRSVLDATDMIFARRVVVTRHRDVHELCNNLGVDSILHELPFRSDTVRLGLEAVGDVDGCIFCQSDQPLLSRDTVLAMALSAVNDRDLIIRAAYGDVQASPVLFPRSTFAELMSLPEGKGGGVVVKRYPKLVCTVQTEHEYELSDVDTHDDLMRLMSYMK